MCGLVGAAGDVSANTERMFNCLLQLDTVRGPHSTGVAAVQGGRKVIVAKSLGTPWDLMDTKAYDSISRGFNKVLLGHNRWATKGKITRANAHPFEFNSVVGAHNGTLRTTHQLDDHDAFEVDSENLYHDMDKNGVYATIPKLNGAFALTWYNKDDHTINFIRNEERPLFYTYSEDMKTLFWASEAWMLLVAANQCKVKIHEPIELPIGVLHTFEIPSFSSDKFDKVRTRKIELYKPPVVYTGKVFPEDNNKKVTYLRPKSEVEKATKTIKSFTEYQKYMGKKIVFYVGNRATTHHNQSYIQCWLAEDEDISVRVFAQEDSSLWRLMMLSANNFSGTVRSYGESDGKYLTIDLRTVEEVIPVEDDVLPDLYKGFGGELITEQVFDERTKHGCSWCSVHVSVDDEDDIVWIGKSDFICPDCVEQPEVKEYLTAANK